jgi:ABC-type polysaccharide/polyol phosphate export permease
MLRVAGQLFRFRGLLATLTGRELKARYRGSVLGFLWSLANPLLLLAVYTFVFSVVFRPRVAGADPYALFVVSGLFPWIWLATSTLEGSMSLIANGGLIRKAVFPAELLPMVTVLSNLVHLLLALPVVLAALAASWLLTAHGVGGVSVLLLPLVILIHLPLVAGLALGASALTVHFKDLRDLLANLFTLFFFLTPVLYRIESIEHIRPVWWLVRLNPFTPFILAYQQVLFYGQAPAPQLWAQMALVSLASWTIGSWLFERLRETLVEAV